MFFAATSFVLACMGKLTTEYVAVITALGVSITARAISQDHTASK
jgi:hypothetical protein